MRKKSGGGMRGVYRSVKCGPFVVCAPRQERNGRPGRTARSWLRECSSKKGSKVVQMKHNVATPGGARPVNRAQRLGLAGSSRRKKSGCVAGRFEAAAVGWRMKRHCEPQACKIDPTSLQPASIQLAQAAVRDGAGHRRVAVPLVACPLTPAASARMPAAAGRRLRRAARARRCLPGGGLRA